MNPEHAGRRSRPWYWLASAGLIAVVIIGVRYIQSSNQLVCATSANAQWRIQYVGGSDGGLMGFMWTIQPTDKDSFLGCLQESGYEIIRDQSGRVTADYTGPPIGGAHMPKISNDAGDEYISPTTFYRW